MSLLNHKNIKASNINKDNKENLKNDIIDIRENKKNNLDNQIKLNDSQLKNIHHRIIQLYQLVIYLINFIH